MNMNRMYTKEQFLNWKKERTWDAQEAMASAYDLYRDYEAWCVGGERLSPAPLGIWSQWMQRLHRKVEREAIVVEIRPGVAGVRRKWYAGIRLKPVPQTVIPANKNKDNGISEI